MPADHRTHDLLRPQSPAVYRRRRLVAAVLLVVVLVLVALLIGWVVSLFRPAPEAGGGAPAATPTATDAPASGASDGDPDGGSDGDPTDGASPSASADASDGVSASPSGSASDAAASGDCPAGDIVISAATDQPTYAEGEDPVLELRVDNTGDEPCTANLGTNQQAFTVYSGSDRIFSTQDCQVDAEDTLVEISPDTQERARFTWPRVRSLPDCGEIDAEPRSGTYRLEVSLGELTAQPVSFTLQ